LNALPIGVRTVSTITASGIWRSPSVVAADRQWYGTLGLGRV
jgi:hypothetical protein